MTNYKYIPALILAAASLASCSQQDEVLATAGDEIRISAVYDNTSRATTAYCPANMPEGFTLLANLASDGSAFIKSTSVVKTAGGYDFADGQTRYWPKDDLFVTAYLNDEKTYSNGQFVNYQIKPEVAKQLDLLYAVNPAAKQTDGAIRLNFRHALSQVVFKGIVANRTIKVNVRSVSVGGVFNRGTFTLPTDEATTETWLDPKTDHENPDNGTTNKKYPSTGVGSWEVITSDATSEYTVEANATLSAPTGTTTTSGEWLTAYSSHSGDWNKVMILMPQETAAWNPEAPADGGAYICVDCDINNVDGTTETLVHSGKMYIPLQVNWKPGFRYVYTIIFGNGDNAYDDKDTPDKIFFPVNVDITVDDFLPEAAEADYGTPEQFTVTFHEYGNNETTPVTVDAVKYGAQYVVTTPATYAGNLPEGGEFIGWSTVAGSIEPMCKPGETIKLFEGDEIYPVIVKYFTVNYHFNSTDDYITVKKFAAAPEAETYSLTLPEFAEIFSFKVADGWNFYGWAYSATDPTYYAAGTTLELTQPATKLISRWYRSQQ